MVVQRIELSEFRKVGLGIERPEDVVVGADGRVWASDKASACAEILPDGSLRRVGQAGGEPNGINIDAEGRIVIANFQLGAVQRLDPVSGRVETICEEVEGTKLAAPNYPILDRSGNIWCTDSTVAGPSAEMFDGRTDGILFRIAPDGSVRLMADGLHFANGLALDERESHIYVCETSSCNVVRFPIRGDGGLGPREQYGPTLGDPLPGDADFTALSDDDRRNLGWTDGCGFDAEGNLWVTLVMMNKIVAITPSGEVVTVADDPSGEVISAPTNVSWAASRCATSTSVA